MIKTLHCWRKQIFPFRKKIHPHFSDLHWRHDLWADVYQQWFPDVSPDDQNYPQGQQGAADAQQSNWSGEKRVSSLVRTLSKCMSRGAVMEIACVLLLVLTVEDVIVAGLCGDVVLGEHPRRGPDDGRVNGEDVPPVFVQDRIFQEEPAGNPSVLVMFKIQLFQLFFRCFFALTNKQNHGQKRERKSDRIFWGHFCVFDQHDAQINQRGNCCPGCIYGDDVLNLQKTDADTVIALRLGQKVTNISVNVLSDQRALEPQVDFGVFAEPRSLNVEAVAGVEYLHIVGQSN